MIDSKGYRANVGIIISNQANQVFWCKRSGQDGWQFPQGGIQRDETPQQAMFRELEEETGLLPSHVEVVGVTKSWLRYRLPNNMIRRDIRPCCVGQKQMWFMLRLLSDDACVKLDATDKPEFDNWCWVDYWRPMHEVVFFKRNVYERALNELAHLLFSEDSIPAQLGVAKLKTK